jgi:hypothetical protein
MNNYLVRPDERERTDPCRCCGRPTRSACGAIIADGREIASYWYRWPEGHEGRFAIAVAWDDGEPFVATATAQASRLGIRYGLHEVPECPFGDMSDYGRHVGRSELMSLPAARTFWKFVDVIASHEPNLHPRVKQVITVIADKDAH